MITSKRARQILTILGAKDPKGWAASHDQFSVIQRWLFLTGLWRMVLGDEAAWERGVEDTAANRILAAGADPRDLGEVVRQTQIDLLYEVCQLLDLPSHGIEDLQEKVPENIEWRLCEFDGEKEKVGRPMQDLHAGFHGFDPTGREGEPRSRQAKNTARKVRASPVRRTPKR